MAVARPDLVMKVGTCFYIEKARNIIAFRVEIDKFWRGYNKNIIFTKIFSLFCV